MKFLYASRLPPVPLTITTLYDTYITAVSTIFLLGYKDYKKKEERHLDSELIHAHLFPKAEEAEQEIVQLVHPGLLQFNSVFLDFVKD